MKPGWRFALCLCGVLLPYGQAAVRAANEVKVGSKQFTESVILAEVLRDLAADVGAQVTHRQQLGGTPVVWKALLNGDIDAYVDYTGTITASASMLGRLTQATRVTIDARRVGECQ